MNIHIDMSLLGSAVSAQAAVFILHEDLSLWQDGQKEIHRAVRGKFCTVVGDRQGSPQISFLLKRNENTVYKSQSEKSHLAHVQLVKISETKHILSRIGYI